MLIEEILAISDLATVRASTDGKALSPEMTLLLSLVIFDGYEIGGHSEGSPLPVSGRRDA